MKTLLGSPGVKIEQENITQRESEYQTASGAFDFVGNAGLSYSRQHTPASSAQIAQQPPGPNNSVLNTFFQESDSLLLGVNKTFRTGVVLAPSISTYSVENNTDQPDAVNWADVKVALIVPLLAGLGADAAGADETAAKINVEAARHRVKNNISRRVYETVEAYWNYWSSHQVFSIVADTQNRSEELVGKVKKFIAIGELAPDYIHQVNAKLFARNTELDNARFELQKARQRLGLAMGVDPYMLLNIPDPSPERPPLIEGARLGKLNLNQMVDQSLQIRGDHQAAKIQVDAQDVLVKKADNALLPDLSLRVEVGYGGMSESGDGDRYFSSTWSNTRGMNTFSGLTLMLPIENNAAKGVFARQKSLLRRAKLSVDELSSRVATEVIVALEALKSSANEHEMARKSAIAYKKSVDATYQRLRIGEASLFEVVDMEDKLFAARVTELRSLVKHAAALAQLRLATGTILQDTKGALTFNKEDLISLPFQN